MPTVPQKKKAFLRGLKQRDPKSRVQTVRKAIFFMKFRYFVEKYGQLFRKMENSRKKLVFSLARV
jgi:hypothetical protein